MVESKLQNLNKCRKNEAARIACAKWQEPLIFLQVAQSWQILRFAWAKVIKKWVSWVTIKNFAHEFQIKNEICFAYNPTCIKFA